MCSVNFSAKGWTAALSCGNIKFVRFGLIFRGTSSDSSNACRYQSCSDHAGKSRIPVAWSQHIFLMTFVSRLNGGNMYEKWWLQFIEKASTAKASGSGFQETQFPVGLSIRLAISQFLVNQRCHGKSVNFWWTKGVTYSFLHFRNQLSFSWILKFSKIFICLKIIFAWNVCCTDVQVSTSTPNLDFFCHFITFVRFQATFFVYM